jgi:serine/threonine protein kinase
MALASGTRLGSFTIEAPIGEGGMGQVYKARDTRLDRTVAIKVLPPQLSGDPEFRERFEREAKSISQLSHPNICTLHDIGEAPGPQAETLNFLVLEYLEGETLAARLERGPVPIRSALKIASEIAVALDVAHRHGIVHRDLKPGNIFLCSNGASSGRSRSVDASATVKLLDFGLAKTDAPRPVSGAAATAAITAAGPLTMRGAIMGTLQYMAPEQVEGLDADARTDIFAFGAVLFEMLTGRRAFQGKSEASLLGAILNEEPPAVSTITPASPPALDHLVRTCLAKNPDGRFQTAHDIGLQLKWIAEGGAGAQALPQARSHSRQVHLIWGAAALGLAVIAAAGAWRLKPAPAPSSSVTRFSLPLAEEQSFSAVNRHVVAISPDGTRIAYVANRQLYLRDLSRIESAAVRGTDEPSSPSEPMFSPDGQWLAYFTPESAAAGADQPWLV